MDVQPNARQRELIDRAYRLAVEKFAPRAEKHDREASFPFDDYRDLHESGLLALCIPEEYGGLGGDFETYALVAEQIARGNAATALTYNMHATTFLMMRWAETELDLPPDVVERHREISAPRYREVVEQGVFYGQPHSEPVEQGEHDQLEVGGRRFGTRAEAVDGGYRVNGRKFFVSLSDSANYFATPALLMADGTWEERTLYLAVPRDAPGVEWTGEWDPLGMRATVSREMILKDVWVPESANILPPGGFGMLYRRHGQTALSFSATFLGLMQAAYDYTLQYLRGEVKGAPGLQTEAPARGYALAEMLFTIEAARALFYRAISEIHMDPTEEEVQRARAAHVLIQKSVVQVTAEAIRVCGGRAMLKRHPLERYYRDARAAAVMRPWTQDIATQQAWETALGTL